MKSHIMPNTVSCESYHAISSHIIPQRIPIEPALRCWAKTMEDLMEAFRAWRQHLSQLRLLNQPIRLLHMFQKIFQWWYIINYVDELRPHMLPERNHQWIPTTINNTSWGTTVALCWTAALGTYSSRFQTCPNTRPESEKPMTRNAFECKGTEHYH